MSSASLQSARPSPSQKRSSAEGNGTPTSRSKNASPVASYTRTQSSSNTEVKQIDKANIESVSSQSALEADEKAGEEVPAGGQDHTNGQEEEEKKCWICFADSSEDTPETSAWRDPCPCALVAHEQCLLDWIADMEASRNLVRSIGKPRILCPQCKGAIVLQRPTDLLVELVRFAEHWSARLVLPSGLALVLGTVFERSFAFGVHSVYTVFGVHDGLRMLRPLALDPALNPIEFGGRSGEHLGNVLMSIFRHRLTHWRLYLGLPLITPILILSRTKLADVALSVLPIAYVGSYFLSNPKDTLDLSKWPETPTLAFMALPYLRAAYNAYYRAVWEKREARWLREVLPRASETNDDEDAALAAAIVEDNLAEPEGADVDIEIQVPLYDDWDSDEDVILGDPRQLQAFRAPRPGEQRDDAAPVAPAPNVAANGAAAAVRQPAAGEAEMGVQRRVERDSLLSPTALAESLIGALLFPTIAGVSGEILRRVLPLSWTVPERVWTLPGLTWALPGTQTKTQGGLLRTLLQHKWGRSIIGGCLCVVLKDSVLLYVRWKMARLHRRRRILDYDRSKGKKDTKARSGSPEDD